MKRLDSDSDRKNSQSTTPTYENYQEECVFHACFCSGKTLHQIVEFLNIVHETVVFQVSSTGLSLRADDRPSNRQGADVKETLFTDLHIPPTGFSSWFYAATAGLEDSEMSKVITPIPVNAQTLRGNMRGSILAKDSIILYILRDNVEFIHMRVVTEGSSTYKVDGMTKLLSLETLPTDILEPLKAPYYDVTCPIVTFKSIALNAACKDVKAAKVPELTINFYKSGIVITFGNSQGNKIYPHGLISGVPSYSATFAVKKRFEALAKCTTIAGEVSLFATKGSIWIQVTNRVQGNSCWSHN
jgi:hypothetical protein